MNLIFFRCFIAFSFASYGRFMAGNFLLWSAKFHVTSSPIFVPYQAQFHDEAENFPEVFSMALFWLKENRGSQQGNLEVVLKSKLCLLGAKVKVLPCCLQDLPTFYNFGPMNNAKLYFSPCTPIIYLYDLSLFELRLFLALNIRAFV